MSKYQLLPPLNDDELAALRDDIQANGVRVPIDVDEEGEVLDGHHRKAVAIMLGIECPERVIHGLQEFEKVDYALTVNMARRHLGREERRELVKKSLIRDTLLADREHARRCGVHHDTVGRIRGDLELLGKLKPAQRRKGADGKERQLAESASSKPSGPSATSPATSPGAGSGENPPAGPPSTPDASGETDSTGEDQPEHDHSATAVPSEAAEDASRDDDSAGGSTDSPGSVDERERRDQPAGGAVPVAPVSDPTAEKVARNNALTGWAQDTPEYRAAALRKQLHTFMQAGWKFLDGVGPDEIAAVIDEQINNDISAFGDAIGSWVTAVEMNHKQNSRLRLVKGA